MLNRFLKHKLLISISGIAVTAIMATHLFISGAMTEKLKNIPQEISDSLFKQEEVQKPEIDTPAKTVSSKTKSSPKQTTIAKTTQQKTEIKQTNTNVVKDTINKILKSKTDSNIIIKSNIIRN